MGSLAWLWSWGVLQLRAWVEEVMEFWKKRRQECTWNAYHWGERWQESGMPLWCKTRYNRYFWWEYLVGVLYINDAFCWLRKQWFSHNIGRLYEAIWIWTLRYQRARYFIPQGKWRAWLQVMHKWQKESGWFVYFSRKVIEDRET